MAIAKLYENKGRENSPKDDNIDNNNINDNDTSKMCLLFILVTIKGKL